MLYNKVTGVNRPLTEQETVSLDNQIFVRDIM